MRCVAELVSMVTIILEGSIVLLGTGDSRIGSKGGWGGVAETLTGSGGTGGKFSAKDGLVFALMTGRRIVDDAIGAGGGGRVGHGGTDVSFTGRLDELLVCVEVDVVKVDDSREDFGGTGGGLPERVGNPIASSKADPRCSLSSSSSNRALVPDNASCGVLTTVAPLPRGPLRLILNISKELSNLGSDMRIGAAATPCGEVLEEELVLRVNQIIGFEIEGL